jgi:transposase-like protein
VTDQLCSYGIEHRELMPDVIHSTKQYDNNWAEQSREPARVKEAGAATVPVSQAGPEVPACTCCR